MPILRVKALPQKNPEKIPPALKKTCLAIADTLGCTPSNVWAIWEEIKPGHYVEGAEAANIQPASTHPPIASLTCFEGLSAQAIENLLAVAAGTLSAELGLGDNIFMTYDEARSGQVIAGYGIVRKKE